jgi:WD40-like Beta Propeller Repeat
MTNSGRILRWLAGLLLVVSLPAWAASQPPKLNAPSNTHLAVVSDSRIDVYWQDNSANETGFEVHRSADGANGLFTRIASTAASVTARSDLGLNSSTQYCYKIRAFKTADGQTRYSSFSNTACATTLAPPPPNAPTNTYALAVSDSRIDVSWQDNSANETGFEVQRSATGATGTFAPVATTAAGVTAWSDLGLNPSTQYCYIARAFIAANSQASYSDFSNVACATTLPPPLPPGLHVTGVTTGIDLDPDGYWVDVWRDSGGSRIHVTGTSLPANGTVTIPGLDPAVYQVELSRVAVNCDPTSPNPQTVTLSGTAGVAIEFDVTCAPVTQLAFASTTDGNAEIYVINSNGTGSTRLTLHPASDVKPAWSPDGTKIAFQSDRDGNPEIYVMNADGSNPVRLTSTSGNFRPAWSPDGTKIAFASVRDGNSEIYVMNADGSSPLRLTNDPGIDADPAWSPDGTKIAFTSDRNGNPEIYVMNADGSGVARLTSDPSAASSAPDWSPDGGRIAFSRLWCNGASCFQSIFVMNADGTGVNQVTCCDARGPVWSPDGRKIAFTANASVSPVIAVIRPDGTNLVELTSGFDPAWRRSGSCVPISPTEICGNGLDDDCNGLVDAADPACAGCFYGSCAFFGCSQGFICNAAGCCTPHCPNGLWDGDEGDLDCGGSCATKCQTSQHCWSFFDCASGSCVSNVCQ